MLTFLKNRSYDIVKLFLNQIAMSIFGFSLAFATSGHTAVRIASSVFSILFYLFIIYAMMWELGAKDKHKIERKAAGQSYLTGLYMALVSSSFNFVIAILIMLGYLTPAFGVVGGIAQFIVLFTEGMYMGLVLHFAPTVATFGSVWFIFFLLHLPTILIAFLAYFAGSKNFKIFGKR